MPKYIFDVDGTLTPSRQRMDKKFAVWFSKFCENNEVYVVTGSDRCKTIEQLGEYIYHNCATVYQCSGNDVWIGDRQIRTNNWTLPNIAKHFLINVLYESGFTDRTGNHIEDRPGMVNFSVVGRGATKTQRHEYVLWDKKINERINIAKSFNMMFPTLQASVAGETGIDISPKGSDKSQIIEDFYPNDGDIYFFGDKCDIGGNDHSIALALDERCGIVHHVKDWNETWKILKEL